ncbi:MAG TPA: hypothetical protein VKH37_10165 [Ferruginibacter sp.]|nr:hypothetical protein [Ferruginibacter sp.]
MNTLKQLFVTLSVCALFILFAVASKVNKIHYGAFNYSNQVEDMSDTRNYVELNDGTKVYGNKISWKTGLLVKDQIKIDDNKYKISETRGYRYNNSYYKRFKNEYIQRIVHGKANVYVQFTDVTETTTDRNGFSHTRSYTRTDQWGQIGETGEMVGLAGQKDIKKLLADCPAAVELADLSDKKIRKAIKANRNYMNEIFDTYNNGCK